jgi:hypothetical protein
MAGVLYHTTTSSLLEIPIQNPIEVPGMACLSSGCQNGPHAKHMHREFEVPSDMDLAMLGPPILNGWTPRLVHVFATEFPDIPWP